MRSLVHWLSRVSMLVLVLGLACSKAPSDASTSEAIKSSFYSDPALKDDRIDVVVSNGEVTLSGEVSSDAARLQAYKLANETPGVKKVNDMMQVKSSVAQNQPPASVPSGSPKDKAGSSKPPRPSSIPPGSETSKPSDSASVQSSETKSAPAPVLPPPPRIVTLPAGTPIRIQMIDAVNSKSNHIGDLFQASLVAPIVVDNEVIVPTKGTDIFLKLTEAKSAGKFKGQSEVRLELDHLQFNGKSYPLASSTVQETGQSRGKDTAKKVGIGTAVGAAIGAIAGGGKGAAIGAGVGAGAGTAIQVFTKGKEVQVPSETKLDFELEQPAQITLPPSNKK